MGIEVMKEELANSRLFLGILWTGAMASFILSTQYRDSELGVSLKGFAIGLLLTGLYLAFFIDKKMNKLREMEGN
jgi:hypothetical protein